MVLDTDIYIHTYTHILWTKAKEVAGEIRNANGDFCSAKMKIKEKRERGGKKKTNRHLLFCMLSAAVLK